jgi:2-iminobutanoate/2-iminopropanoate deaminase
MEKIRRNYPDIAPAGPTYSRAVRSGNLLFISGCTARGTAAQGKPLMEQLRVTLDRISRIVAAEDGTARDIVKLLLLSPAFLTGAPMLMSSRKSSSSFSRVSTLPIL